MGVKPVEIKQLPQVVKKLANPADKPKMKIGKGKSPMKKGGLKKKK